MDVIDQINPFTKYILVNFSINKSLIINNFPAAALIKCLFLSSSLSFALINTEKYKEILSANYKARWFNINKHPELIFDHLEMVNAARKKLKTKAALYPILFELLPEKFTIPQIILLYEAIYENQLDKRNFTRKLLASNLLIKLDEKDKEHSKKGAYYYQLNKGIYKEKIMSFLKYLPNWYE